MINELLIAEVFNQPWCIEKQYAQGLAMSAMGMLQSPGNLFKPVAKVVTSFAIDQKDNRQTADYQSGSVGIVTLDGPVVENSDPYYGIKGTAEIASELLTMDADPNIIGQVFVCNTGGGAAYAMKVLEDTFNQLQKPVGIYSRQILASAGYGIGAHADFIMMYHPQGIVGSIGTMCSFTDMQPMFEKWGMKFHEIYATLSTLKNKTFNDALEGNYDAMRAKMLDPFNEKFINQVKSLRGDKISSTEKGIYKGETYMATEAVGLGLIDGIGNLNDAVQQVRDLAKSTNSTATGVKSTQKTTVNMNFTKLLALKGKTDVSQEELDAVNAELTEAGITGIGVYPESVINDAATVTTERDQFKTQAETLTGQLTVANSSLTTAQGEVTDLKAKLAKAPAAVAAKVDVVETTMEKTAAELAQAEIDELPHNKAIANNPLFN